jgi:hypothetical protein
MKITKFAIIMLIITITIADEGTTALTDKY